MTPVELEAVIAGASDREISSARPSTWVVTALTGQRISLPGDPVEILDCQLGQVLVRQRLKRDADIDGRNAFELPDGGL